MRIPRIFTPQELHSNSVITLDSAASHYLTRVLRMQAGRELVLFNGQGGEFSARIESLDKQCASVVCLHKVELNRDSPLQIELVIGISRGERMDWILQKATELGVSHIQPVFSARTEVRLKGDRLQKKLLHWQQILISACEQCQLNIVPKLIAPVNLEDYCRDKANAQLKFVLHHRTDQSLAALNKTLQQPPSSVVLLVGPEGGLSEDEISLALDNNFKPLKLGPRVLRTETAPIVALSVVQQLWGDLNDI